MIRFLKKINKIVFNNTNISLRISIILMIFIMIMTFAVQYHTTVLQKKQNQIKNDIYQLENEIQILTSEYIALISPYKIKKLTELYLPSFKYLNASDI